MQYTAGTQVLSDWKIVRELGEGSFGRVFEIQKTDFGITSKSALKIIRIPRSVSDVKAAIADGMDEQSVTTYFQGVVNEIVKEIAIMSSLKSHPNVVSCEDHRVVAHHGTIGWDILIRMELLTPLDDFQLSCPMNEALVRRLGMDICSALVFCQKKGLIHRDIKPGNIFVSEAGLFKLGDFGVARTAERTTGGLSKKGTEHYMAPEVYIGNPYGASVDIYSLGLVLYKFMNGNRLPFFPPYPQPITPDSRENALIARIQGKPLASPVNASPEFAKIILKACAHNPKQRYANAAEMLADLQRLPAIQDNGYAAPAAVEDAMATMLDPTYYTAETKYEATQATFRQEKNKNPDPMPASKPAGPKYQIVLTGSGTNKLGVIKAVRGITGAGLAEAASIVDQIPSLVKKDISWEEAQTFAKEILEAGGSYEVALSGSPVKTRQAEQPKAAPKVEPVKIPTPPKAEPKSTPQPSPKPSGTTASSSPFTQPSQHTPPKTAPQPTAQPKQTTPPKTTATPTPTPPVQPSKPAKKKKGCLPFILILIVLSVIGAIAEKAYQPKPSETTPPSIQAEAESTDTSAALTDEDYAAALEAVYRNLTSDLASSHYIYTVPMPSFVQHAVHLNEQGFLFYQFDEQGTYSDTLVVNQLTAGEEVYTAYLQPEAAVLDGAQDMLGTVTLKKGPEDEALSVNWQWDSNIINAEELYASTTFTDSLPMMAGDLCSDDLITPICTYYDINGTPGLADWVKSVGNYYSDSIYLTYSVQEDTYYLGISDPNASTSAVSGIWMWVEKQDDLFRYSFGIDYAPANSDESASQSESLAGESVTDKEFQAAWEAVWENVKYELANPETVPFNLYAPDMTADRYAEFMLGMGCQFLDNDSGRHDEILWREETEYSRRMHTIFMDRTQYQTHLHTYTGDNCDQISSISFTTSKSSSAEYDDLHFANGVMPDLFDLRMDDTFETLCANMGITQEMLDWIGATKNDSDDYSGSQNWTAMGIRLYSSIDSQTYHSLEFTNNSAASGTVRQFGITLSYTDDGYWHIHVDCYYQD